MCETVLISNRVRRLSRRSYNHRLVIASSERYHVAQLARLNRELDSLYELIYDDRRNITEEDYRVFGGQFEILVQTVKLLYDSCRKMPKSSGFQEETKRLGMNYSALHELQKDIVNFCIKLPKNQELKDLLKRLSDVDKTLQKTASQEWSFTAVGYF